ncbi:hypothetical protein TSUD_226060 [Trifolium subterraneum]|uniref:Uncharacterized protein n=1 Tax=Trifolium subterraneum TaxID=3900 RepID=A0A2Z6M7U0_TRISU|nr:hypothetical protein TSUD_226060 [Trifolium subterraneum]
MLPQQTAQNSYDLMVKFICTDNVIDFYVQIELRKSDLKSHIGSYDPVARAYIELDDPPLSHSFEVELV